MSRTIVAITTTTTGKKRYVADITPRFNNDVSVELSANDYEAKDFLARAAAEDVIPKIFNPFERIYQVETLNVIQPNKIIETKSGSCSEQRVLK